MTFALILIATGLGIYLLSGALFAVEDRRWNRQVKDSEMKRLREWLREWSRDTTEGPIARERQEHTREAVRRAFEEARKEHAEQDL